MFWFSQKKKPFLFSFLKFIIDNLYWSQKLHMLSIYRQEYNFGKYAIDDTVFLVSQQKFDY